MMGFGLGMGLFGLLIMFLFWGGLAALAIWLVSLLFPSAKKVDTDNTQSASAQEIIKSRYARGELTQEQYYQMLQTLDQ